MCVVCCELQCPYLEIDEGFLVQLLARIVLSAFSFCLTAALRLSATKRIPDLHWYGLHLSMRHWDPLYVYKLVYVRYMSRKHPSTALLDCPPRYPSTKPDTASVVKTGDVPVRESLIAVVLSEVDRALQESAQDLVNSSSALCFLSEAVFPALQAYFHSHYTVHLTQMVRARMPVVCRLICRSDSVCFKSFPGAPQALHRLKSPIAYQEV